jgi:acetyl esterase/lipase
MTDGEARLKAIIGQLPMTDAREDIDTESLVRRFPPLGGVSIDEVIIEGPAGRVPARRYAGPSAGSEGLVWVHGGAFITGSLDMPESHWVAMEIAARGVAVLALDYRKAVNGVHHPALSDDVLAGWMAASEILGLPIDRVHLGGASAGANLSAGVALRLRNSGNATPASLTLVYPVLHPVLPEASPEAADAVASLPHEARFLPDFTRAINVNYVGKSELLSDPVAFPANSDASALPRTLILNAEADDLRASGEAFAAQLTRAGVPVELEFEPTTRHGYLDHPGEAPALASIERIAAWLREDVSDD